ncbi:MAG: ribonuclease Z [Bacteroidales bacterium]|jgi:ribonuclease Z
MEFSLTTLGTASALPNVNRYSSAHVFNIHGRLFLVDCGEGCQVQLRRYGFSFAKIDNIFISHLHGDHIFGIFGLLSTMSLTGRTADLYIYAPRDFSSILNFFLAHFGDGVRYNIIHKVLNCTTQELIFSSRTVEVYAFPLNHRISTFGFLFKEKEPKNNIYKWKIESACLTLKEIASLKDGNNVIRENGEVLEVAEYTYKPYNARSAAYCSDTAPFERLSTWIDGVDLLYHEATFAEDMSKMAKDTYHSTAKQAGLIAKTASVGKMIIGHYSSRYKDLNILLNEAKNIFPETYLAKEGMKFEVPINKN